MQLRLVIYTGLLCLAVICLLLFQHYCVRIDTTQSSKDLTTSPIYLPTQSFISPETTDIHSSIINNINTPPPTSAGNCRMDNCFDYSKCKNGFKVHVYPISESANPSESYLKIINVIKSSQYYTPDVSKACIFISSIDTLDRDKLSPDYVSNLHKKLSDLPYWNNGRNHVIYNLYSGTWPDYSEHFGIDTGEAILAKASISTQKFRAGFDISLPLFHKELPERAGARGQFLNLNVPSNRKYLLAFKGKRYLAGIGSVSRNSLYHIHNGRDIIMLTTCKHGIGWEKIADERCAEDNALYDQFDYQDLLANSTFCLVPRGRRLGSFRFLEVLQYGCIPVLLSDNWVLPFSEVIDWRKAAIWGDEDLLYQLPFSIRTMPIASISSLQQQSQLLWTKYFSSFDKIVQTTLQIIKDRVDTHEAHSLGKWNTYPGAYALTPTYSNDLSLFPYYTLTHNMTQFTALLYITERSMSLKQVIESITSAGHIHTLYIFVVGRRDVLAYASSVSKSFQGRLIHVKFVNTVIESFRLYREFPTDAVLIINQRESVLTEEVDFAFSVWKEYPDRIVGHLSRSHLWHNGEQKYHYTSKVFNEYSIVLSDTSVIHKYYLHLLLNHMDKWNGLDSDSMEQCYDILLNFIVGDVSGLPPIKVGQRLSYSKISTALSLSNRVNQRDSCVDIMYHRFGYMPLKLSQVRLDPALFKDNVARYRKRYPLMENVT